MRIKRKVGDRNGLLTIESIEKKGNCNYLNCRCDCGNLREVDCRRFKNITSCGCLNLPRRKNNIGHKKHFLTIIEIYKNNKGKTRFKCQCDCGRSTDIADSSFGVTKTCGCIADSRGEKRGTWKGYGEISGSRWCGVINDAKKRDMEFCIDIKYAWEKFLEQNRKCAYTGEKLVFNHNRSETTASLDRIDSSKGYIEGNVQWVHKKINLIKMHLKEEEFIEACNKVSLNFSKFKLDVTKIDFDDVLIVPKPSTVKSRADVNLVVNYETKYSKKEIKCIPIIASNMDAVGVKKIANSFSNNNLMTCIHKFHSENEIIEILTNNSNVFYSLGMTEADYLKLTNISKKITIKNICLDVANAYSEEFVKYCAKIRREFPFAIIMAGNVASAEGVKILINEGMVDICKIGIGSGSVCKTRTVAGIGSPQFSLIKECMDVVKYTNGGLICSDGGIRYIADFCKAFAAGAHFVMAGGFFAGHDECEGDWELEPNWVDEKNEHGNLVKVQKGYKKKCLKFYGMSSTEAMNKYHNGVAEYRASEGKCVQVPSKGPVQNTINDILGGLRSSCSYIGSHNLQDMKNNATFIKVNRTHDNFS